MTSDTPADLIELAERLEATADDLRQQVAAMTRNLGRWTTADVADLPIPCWVERPGDGTWWCVANSTGSPGTRRLHMHRRSETALWTVTDGHAVRYRPDPRPPLDVARDMADSHAGRADWLLAQEPADGEALDVQT